VNTKSALEFRRVVDLPPYAFAKTDALKIELRRDGEDVIDMGFGNPDLPSHPLAVEKLKEAAEKGRNHRYSQSRGIPRLRKAVCDLYERKFGVVLDPETQAINTIGAKEGLSHLMWVLLGPGDAAVVPTPTYPIHRFAPIFAGATVFEMAMREGEDLFGNMVEAFEKARPRPRVIILSFPSNPTAMTVELDFMQKAVDFAREKEVFLVHDFAYADLAYDGYQPPST
jgi:alanine-synthesizing transaminase